MIKIALMVGLGGGLGSVLRMFVSRWLNESGGFPWGTYVVNVGGCLLIGALYSWFARGTQLSDEVRMLLTVGLCGGLTTFSTFINEGALMTEGRQWMVMLGYTLISLLSGFAAIWIGRWLIERVW